ncbi:MAG: hypothetical protein LBC19_04625 [Tannerella sp.]|jgi:hypothetical protein|nr:hypothetical protein [Tannerella sp.]
MKGINFIEPLFHRVVSGEKTQTRRIIPCPVKAYGGIQAVKKDGKIIRVRALDENERAIKPGSDDLEWILTPRYNVGEILYIKEPYCQDCNYIENENSKEWKGNGRILYRYRGDQISEHAKGSVCLGKWKNRLSMPAKFARYFIEITDVRAERLQDISDEDCIREGIELYDGYDNLNGYACIAVWKKIKGVDFFPPFDTPKQSYAALIDRINGKGTWESNPFVWVYDFKLVK